MVETSAFMVGGTGIMPGTASDRRDVPDQLPVVLQDIIVVVGRVVVLVVARRDRHRMGRRRPPVGHRGPAMLVGLVPRVGQPVVGHRRLAVKVGSDLDCRRTACGLDRLAWRASPTSGIGELDGLRIAAPSLRSTSVAGALVVVPPVPPYIRDSFGPPSRTAEHVDCVDDQFTRWLCFTLGFRCPALHVGLLGGGRCDGRRLVSRQWHTQLV